MLDEIYRCWSYICDMLWCKTTEQNVRENILYSEIKSQSEILYISDTDDDDDEYDIL